MRKTVSGINVQFPFSKLILEGKKTIETRAYAIPPKYIGQPLAMIETPGKEGNFDARIVGLVTFAESFRYRSMEQFQNDYKKHFVDKSSAWRWKSGQSKWGWPIVAIEVFNAPLPAPKNKGIKFTLNIRVDIQATSFVSTSSSGSPVLES